MQKRVEQHNQVAQIGSNKMTNNTRHKSVINWKQSVVLLLESAAKLRPAQARRWTRVSKKEMLPKMESVLRTWAEDYVSSLPSKGKTIK